jgi:hypothetical protein
VGVELVAIDSATHLVAQGGDYSRQLLGLVLETIVAVASAAAVADVVAAGVLDPVMTIASNAEAASISPP